MMSFTVCTVHQILSRWSYKRG